jgi:hypothetical protein
MTSNARYAPGPERFMENSQDGVDIRSVAASDFANQDASIFLR